MQESQKAFLKYLSDALVCASSTSSSNTSSSIPSSTSKPADSMDRDVAAEAIAQSVYSLIGTEADVFYIISKNVQISYEQEQLHHALKSIPYVGSAEKGISVLS